MPAKIKTYSEYREHVWETQDLTGFDAHKGTLNGQRPGQFEDKGFVALIPPKEKFHLNDTWHCATLSLARQTAAKILTFPDVVALQLKASWVIVSFDNARSAQLPGLPRDPRKLYRGV